MTQNDTHSPATVADEMVVSMMYTLRLDDGEVVDSTEDGDLFEYLHGFGQIVPGLEAALLGMKVGDEADVEVAPEDGYGEWQDDAFEELPRGMFPDDVELVEGLALYLEDDDGGVFEVYVDEVRPDSVVIDHNHPLAGETLHFHVRIVGVRPATAEELAHGHVHGEGDHHHH